MSNFPEVVKMCLRWKNVRGFFWFFHRLFYIYGLGCWHSALTLFLPDAPQKRRKENVPSGKRNNGRIYDKKCFTFSRTATFSPPAKTRSQSDVLMLSGSSDCHHRIIDFPRQARQASDDDDYVVHRRLLH